jgi:hypothetical protein
MRMASGFIAGIVIGLILGWVVRDRQAAPPTTYVVNAGAGGVGTATPAPLEVPPGATIGLQSDGTIGLESIVTITGGAGRSTLVPMVGGSGGGFNDGSDWGPMSTAPKDGTIIEIRCTYGVAPWYGLFRWSNTVDFGHGAGLSNSAAWRGVPDSRQGIASEDATFSWRPYYGQPGQYDDPTHGAQNTREYWLRAVGR